MQGTLMQRRIRWSAALIAVGTVVQLATLGGVHPLGFVAFLLVGCPLVLAGMVIFLFSLLSRE